MADETPTERDAIAVITKRDLEEQIRELGPDDLIHIGMIMRDDEEDDGFTENETASKTASQEENSDDDPEYTECKIRDAQTVVYEDGTKELTLFIDPVLDMQEEDEDEEGDADDDDDDKDDAKPAN